MFRAIVPQDRVFFDLFDRLAEHLVEGTAALVQMMATEAEGWTEAARSIKEVERRADETVHEGMERLHTTFVTPIDREDIHRLIVTLDDVVDQAHAAASRLDLYRPRQTLTEAQDLARKLHESATVVRDMVGLLRSLKQRRRIIDLAVQVNSLENEGDTIRREAVARLLREESDPFEFIKWKEILDFVEDGIDRCEDVADIIEGIVLEHS